MENGKMKNTKRSEIDGHSDILLSDFLILQKPEDDENYELFIDDSEYPTRLF